MKGVHVMKGLSFHSWLGPDQYMYMKEELTQCICFGTAHALTTYTRKWVEGISNSYPTFINVLQTATLSLPNLLTVPVNANKIKTGLSKE